MTIKFAVVECYSGMLVDTFQDFEDAFECCSEHNADSDGGSYHIFRRLERSELENYFK